MVIRTELFFAPTAHIWLEAASSEHMIQLYMLTIMVLALGFVVSEVSTLFRIERTKFTKAKAIGALTWRQRISIWYLAICAAGEICHRILLVTEAYYT